MENTTNKYLIWIDNVEFIADGFGYEYSQFDGEGSGRGDDFTMIRDVGGVNTKLYATFNDKNRWYGKNLSSLLQLIDKDECVLRFFDAKAYEFVEKRMYITVSKCDVNIIDNEIYLKEPIEVHFIQMDVDSI